MSRPDNLAAFGRSLNSSGFPDTLIATQAEANAGTAADKLLTPQRVSATTLPTGTATYNASTDTLTLDMAGQSTMQFAHTVSAGNPVATMTITNAPTTGWWFALLRLTNGGTATVALPTTSVVAGGATAGIGTLTSAGLDELLLRGSTAAAQIVVSIRKDIKA